MKFGQSLWLGGLVCFGWASHGMGQELMAPAAETPQTTPSVLSRFLRPCQPRLRSAYVPSDPNAPAQPPSSQLPGDEDNLPQRGGYKEIMGVNGSLAGGGLASSASAIAATTNAAGVGVGRVWQTAMSTTTTTTSTPLILPGLFTATSAQSVVAVDRIFVGYGYTNGFSIVNSAGTVPGFNLNQFNIGVEKTFLDGMASFYVSVPFLYATDNISGQNINGLGDVDAGFKLILLNDRQTGNTLSMGLTVTTPTAHATVISRTTTQQFTPLTGVGNTPPGSIPVPGMTSTTYATASTSVNPTYIQPWIGGLLVLDRVFVQEYFGVLTPTDDRVSTFLNNNFTVGYELFRGNAGGWVTSVTPTFGAQLLIPVTHTGTQGDAQGTTSVTQGYPIIQTTTPYSAPPVAAPSLPSAFNSPDQLFLSAGAQIGLGQRTLFSAGVNVPVVGPRAYTIGASFGLTYFY